MLQLRKLPHRWLSKMALKMLAVGTAMILFFQSSTLAQTTRESASAFSTTTATPSMCTGITLFAVPGQVGYLSSSNYTFDYNDYIECSWTINSTGGYVIKATILKATSPFYFFIDIRDGMWPSPNILAWIRGMPSHTVYYSSGQYMYIRFVDPSHSPDTYFSLTYEAVNESLVPTPGTTQLIPPTLMCSKDAPTVYVAPGQNGYLTSPNYPYSYNDDSDCQWLINAGSGNVVKVSVLNVSLDRCCDYFELYDGTLLSNATPITRISSMPSQTVFYSSGQYMYIRFYSDYVDTFSGFLLTFQAIDQQSAPPECPVNGTTLSASLGRVGYLRFPNHPSSSSNNTDCEWVINSTSGSVIKVTVFNASSDIFYHIEIFDGMSELSPTLVSFYGMPPQTDYYSSGQYIYIRFTGNGSVTNSGLMLSYEAVNQPSVLTSGPTDVTTSPSTTDACTCTCSCVSTCSHP